MTKKELYQKRTEELLLPIVEDHGFELVDVEYVKEGFIQMLPTPANSSRCLLLSFLSCIWIA